MKQKDDLKNERFAGYRAAQHLFMDALQDLCNEDERYRYCYYDNDYSKNSVTENDMTKPLAALFGPLLRDGISLKTIAEFYAGFAGSGELSQLERYYDIDCEWLNNLEGRLTFPLFNDIGDVVGFAGRRASNASGAGWMLTLDKKAKSDGLLFGLLKAKCSSKDWFLLCERIPEVMLLHQLGYDNAMCPIGSRFITERHAKLIKKYRKAVTVLFDNDEHGRRRMTDATKTLLTCGFTVSNPFFFINCSKNLVGLLKREDGKERLEKALHSGGTSINEIDRKLNDVFEQYDLSVLDQRISCAKDCVVQVAEYAFDPYSLDAIAGEIENKTGVSKRVLLPELKQWHEWNTNRNVCADKKKDDLTDSYDDIPF